MNFTASYHQISFRKYSYIGENELVHLCHEQDIRFHIFYHESPILTNAKKLYYNFFSDKSYFSL